MANAANSMPGPGCLMSSAAHSPSLFDAFDRVNMGLRALAGHLHPSDDVRRVPREDLAMLLSMLDTQPAGMACLAATARIAVVDLIGAGHHLDCLAREHLPALIAMLPRAAPP